MLKLFLNISLKISFVFLIFTLSSFDLKIGILDNKRINRFTVSPINNTTLIIGTEAVKSSAKFNIYRDNIKIDIDGRIKFEKQIKILSDGLFSLKFNNSERYYKGKISVQRHGKSFLIINSLDIEDYVKAVASAEAEGMDSIEAIKANVIAIRTYAIAAMNRHIDEGYNLCDLTHCQLYIGFEKVNDKIIRTVDDTRGIIITYNNKPIWAMYHSNCGGRTETAADVWDYDTMPYLKSIDDRIGKKFLCSGGWAYRWKTRISLKKFESFLRNSIISKNEKFLKIDDVNYTEGGRVKNFNIVTDKRKINISGIDFYHLVGRYLGWMAIKSTAFSVDMDNKYVIFDGKGYGHGVGMCQAGADEMGKLGYNYKEIIEHYYKDIKLKKI
jgi:stage II sporulation protein D